MSRREGSRGAGGETSSILGEILNSAGCWSAMFWTVSTVIRWDSTISIWWSLRLFRCGSCSCGRSCGLFAMQNSAGFLLLVSNSKKVWDFSDSSSYRAWNIRFWGGNPAARITLAMLHFPIPFCFLVNSLTWLWISSSTSFYPDLGSLRFAYAFNGVCCSSCVPNFAISLFLTVTTCFSRSLIVEVVGLIFRICEPESITSYNPSKFFFERRFPWIFRAKLNSTARSLRVIGWMTFVRRKRESPSVLARSIVFASCVARDIPISTSMSLRYPFTHLSSRSISSGITVSSSK